MSGTKMFMLVWKLELLKDELKIFNAEYDDVSINNTKSYQELTKARQRL